MNFEKSCGAIIYRIKDDNLEFLTISHRSDGHWGFPKGHVEKGESEEETAIREIYEETGLQVNLIDGFRESSCVFTKRRGNERGYILFSQSTRAVSTYSIR